MDTGKNFPQPYSPINSGVASVSDERTQKTVLVSKKNRIKGGGGGGQNFR